LVAHVHALEFDRAGEGADPRVTEIERFGLEQADRIIAVSHRTKSMISSRLGIPAGKIDVVHNGIAPRSLPPMASVRPLRAQGSRERLVVFLGRVTMQKGPEYFLEAAGQIARRVDRVRFVMAGAGDLLPRMIARMAELRLVDKFHFTGFVDERRRDELLSRADCFVMTSVSEPFGLTPVEAIQHDVPVVVTRQCGVAEVLPSAAKVDFWDVPRIADAVVGILTRPGVARRMVGGARQDLAGICWERSARQVQRIYQEVV
jgi:glycosyltransferase involved in cell wall biosynthesis